MLLTATVQDTILQYSLDRTHIGHRLRNHGHLLHLPGRVQLPCRHVPSICLFSIGRTKLLPKHARGCVPSCDDANVQAHDFPRRQQLPRRCGSSVDACALRSAYMGSEDSGEKQVCERDYEYLRHFNSHGRFFQIVDRQEPFSVTTTMSWDCKPLRHW